MLAGTPTLYIWGVGDMGWWPRIFSYATSRRGDPSCAPLTLLCAFDLSLAEPALIIANVSTTMLQCGIGIMRPCSAAMLVSREGFRLATQVQVAALVSRNYAARKMPTEGCHYVYAKRRDYSESTSKVYIRIIRLSQRS